MASGPPRVPAYDDLPPEIRGQFLTALKNNPHGWGPSGEGQPEQPYRGPYAETYEPGYRDFVADALRSVIGERNNMMSPEGERLVTGISGATGAGGRGSSIADFVPGLGLATASADSAQALHNGNYPIATLAALSALVPSAIGKVISKAGRGAVNAMTDPVRELFRNPRAGMTEVGPVQARAVHGAPVGDDAYRLDQGRPHKDYWASDAPRTAETYTHLDRAADPDFYDRDITPNLTPVDLDFKNALIINRGGGRHQYWDLPHDTGNYVTRDNTDGLAHWAREQGHDGLVVHNVRDGLGYRHKAPYATTYAALQPGTVKSSLSGAQIFDLAPAAAVAAGTAGAVMPQQQQAPNPDSFEAKLAQLHAVLVDLNGDGRLDAIAPAPNRGGAEQSRFGRDTLPVEQNRMAPNGADSATPPPPNLMFPKMVAENPRGWGNGPPAAEPQPPQPEEMSPGMAAARLVRGAVSEAPRNLMDALPRTAGQAAMDAAMIAVPEARVPLIAAQTYFNSANEAGAGEDQTSKDQVKSLQQTLKNAGYYKGPIDGQMGDGTRDANKAYQADQLEQQRVKAQGDTAAAAKAESDRKAKEQETNAMTRRQGEERLRQMEGDVPWYRRGLRDYGEAVGATIGAVGGALVRSKVKAGAEASSAARTARADALMPAPGTESIDIPARAARVNQFWNEGGAGSKVPFTAAPGTPRGFESNKMAPGASELYEPPGVAGGRLTGTDVGAMVGFGADAGISHVMADRAQQRIEDAQNRVRQDPSEVNIRELEAAKDEAAIWKTMSRAGQAAGVSYGLGTAKSGPSYSRPNLNAAEAERTRLDQLLARPPRNAMSGGQPPSTPPAAPTAPSSGPLPHHAKFQPRDGSRFVPGAPKYPKGDPRAED